MQVGSYLNALLQNLQTFAATGLWVPAVPVYIDDVLLADYGHGGQI